MTQPEKPSHFEVCPIKQAQRLLMENTEYLVAKFIDAHPHIPIADILIINEPTFNGLQVRVTAKGHGYD
jgi:hypothetical protein